MNRKKQKRGQVRIHPASLIELAHIAIDNILQDLIEKYLYKKPGSTENRPPYRDHHRGRHRRKPHTAKRCRKGCRGYCCGSWRGRQCGYYIAVPFVLAPLGEWNNRPSQPQPTSPKA